LKLARYDPQGNLKESLIVAKTSASRRSGFPVIVSHGDDVYLTWTDISSEPRVKVARVQF
jgi:hypothetical protein